MSGSWHSLCVRLRETRAVKIENLIFGISSTATTEKLISSRQSEEPLQRQHKITNLL